MAEPRITLVQVAERAGVSKTTAGYVLSGRDREMRIAGETRDRVLRAATEMNFRPNLLARGLRTSITRPIAVISDTLVTEPFGGQLVYGCMAAAAAHGRLVIVGETRRDPELEAAVVELCLAEQIEDFVYATVYPREVHLPDDLHGRRVVLLNCADAHASTPAVLPDEVGGGRTAARALLRAGHDDGIYLVGDRAPHRYAPGRDRVRGIAEVLNAAGTDIAGSLDCAWEAESAYEVVSTALASRPLPTAFVCFNDRIALGAYQALHEAGVRVPDDMSVLSFEESELAVSLRPQLTSIAHPHYDMGRRAVDLLVAPEPTSGIELLAMPLRLRSSVARPRPAATT